MMKHRKLIFIGMVMLALVLTSGTFAYTYTYNAATTLGGYLADAAWTTYEPSAAQPEWEENHLPVNIQDMAYLAPDAPGDDTELPTQYPDSEEHWDKVDDLSSDEADTYVSTEGSGHWERDLYNLNDFTEAIGLENILGVTVYFRYAAGGDYSVRAMASIKTHGNIYDGPTETHNGADFVTMSCQWLNNPDTDAEWTWDEINELQAGVTMRGNNQNKPAICTQVFVTVDYQYAISEGDVTTGDLFDITPHPDYTGDMLVKLYLTNTGGLLKAYQYLNMKIYLENSMEAESTPGYQVLSIDNGVVTFNLEGGSAESYTVQVVGGSYSCISSDSSQWSKGWSITPEFYCEVSQR